MVDVTTRTTAPRSIARRGAAEFLRIREASIVLVTIALVLYFQSATSVFLTPGNLATISHYVAPVAIIAAGQVLLLVSGEIDLSVGHVYALAPFLMYFGIESYGIPVLLAIGVALLVAACIGLVNGVITVLLGVPSFVTTLGMLFLINGITLVISSSYPRSVPEEAASISYWLGGAEWSELIWALAIIALFQLILSRTRWGLHTVAVGGNKHGASEAGVRVGRIKIGNFVAMSVLGAFTGILECFHINSIEPLAGGAPIMFAAVAAAVIGGTALAGGSGTIVGALFGAIVLGVLKDGLNLLGVNADRFDLILGIAIIAAMVLNVHLARLRTRGRHR